ncbi:MAG: hypothetical protein KIS86_06875 [Devosia sp.]|nr:hypothetical protein [Devosia sp.]
MGETLDSHAMAGALVTSIARVIDLCEASCINSEANRRTLAEGRDALADVAAFFEVEAPEAKPVERT